MPPELSIRILSSKRPLDGLVSGVAGQLPLLDCMPQGLPIGQAAIQALAAKDADLNLRHVQPAGVFGRVVELNPAQQLVSSTVPQDVLEAFPSWPVVRVTVTDQRKG